MYATSLQQILAELERLDLLLRVQVWRARQGRGEAGDLAAFYVPDAEADEFLHKAIGAPVWAGVPLPAEVQATVQARLDQLSGGIAENTAESERAGVRLRLGELAGAFGLTAFDRDVILICLAPELDQGYERLYGYLHDDVTRRRPTVGLVLNLLCTGLPAKAAARARLTAAAPLVRDGLVTMQAEPGDASVLGSGLRLDPRVAGFLLGDDTVDGRLEPYATVVSPADTSALVGDSGAGLGHSRVYVGDLVFPEEFGGQISRLAEHLRAANPPGGGPVLYLQGPYGTGKRTVAAACCQALGRRMLVVAGKRLAAAAPEEFLSLARLAAREARLQGAFIYTEDIDALLSGEPGGTRLASLLSVLTAYPGPAFLSGTATWEPSGPLRGITFLRVPFPSPGPRERLRIWRAALSAGEGASAVGEPDLADLAGAFRFTGGQIRDALATARNLARRRSVAEPQITSDDLRAACRLQSNRTLAELAVHVTPGYAWDDIVLPDDQLTQLREIYDQARYSAQVYGTWGFGAKLATGKGLSILFAGPPGTGKTMAASVLASALRLDLYKIDLSTVVSKYIGETEKNLARIFDEAATSNAILFFDEADALFGTRTQVRDAHDRYANLEISYLLQKMDEYEGIVVLATNLRKNMDEAFVRRLHVTVDFPLPCVADRRRIWEQIWPAATPRDAGLDLDVLARRIEVAGGSIRNIALAGAFLAAADGELVTMTHVLRAARREYQKIGKVLAAGDLDDHDPGALRLGGPR